MGSEPSLRLVWAQNQPNFRPNRQNAGNFAENPCIPGNYPATAWVFCRFPQFCLRFCPRPALRLRETREFPEWSTKHPLFSLEISGNAKCWGPSVFLFVFRKTGLSPGKVGRTEKHPPFMPDPGHGLSGGELGRPPPGPPLARWARVRESIRDPRLSARWARPTWKSTAHRSVLLAPIARSLCNRNARGRAWRVCRSAATSVD